jgi:hypothetical protein
MFDGEALVGPGVKDAWPWQPLVREPLEGMRFEPLVPGKNVMSADAHRGHTPAAVLPFDSWAVAGGY